ncbi:hypothetical protein Smp_060830 [Schistosoma mansoni]|uniref:hypothetical protein n=1 Tax=Schistosoma mansoni TaxID=6183 RepID=UPI00019B36AE|nr:hypothetical protein Smp_060830 [Schistosoma mansoni]|eukprot:XP_018649935.1 hypothetical protein Smp_060830 [Schistosoma mansoni]
MYIVIAYSGKFEVDPSGFLRQSKCISLKIQPDCMKYTKVFLISTIEHLKSTKILYRSFRLSLKYVFEVIWLFRLDNAFVLTNFIFERSQTQSNQKSGMKVLKCV